MSGATRRGLRPAFHQIEAYAPENTSVRPLPMRFARFDDERYVVTNLVGEYILIDSMTLARLIQGHLEPSHPNYKILQSKHFLLDNTSDVGLDLLATKYRTKQAHLAEFTGLHIFVVTLRCEHSCPYCQVSRVSSDRTAYDMSLETALRGVEMAFRSPNRHLKIEFQGGEPLLHFDRVRTIVDEAEHLNHNASRTVAFVLATNLALINEEILSFCKDHRITISTSLDGPRDLHNANRPRSGGDSYERTIIGIDLCRKALGEDSVSALMTTTKASLLMPEAIVDEYARQGFTSIFLRWMSPYGFAARASRTRGYGIQEWNYFYERALDHILNLNRAGHTIREEYASIILRKMLTPYPTGYVDLQSPAGLGISSIVYNYDGDVYASDEARMIAENKDFSFRLGNLHKDSYENILASQPFLGTLLDTMTEAIPQCTDCPFEVYCGTDPLFHHATQGDAIGHRPTSGFCSRNMYIFRLLISKLEDPATRPILESWAHT